MNTPALNTVACAACPTRIAPDPAAPFCGFCAAKLSKKMRDDLAWYGPGRSEVAGSRYRMTLRYALDLLAAAPAGEAER